MKKYLKKYKKLIIISLVVLVVILGSIIIFTGKKEEPTPITTNAFFLKNKKDKYNLYNTSGKLLSDESFKEVTGFYNGIALVTNETLKKGIINQKGKMIIKFDEYEEVYQYGSLIEVKNKKKHSLLNSKGKTIINNKDFDVIFNPLYNSFVVVSIGKYFYIYNYDGKEIIKIKTKNASTIPTVNLVDGIGAFSIDDKTVIFNPYTTKVIKTIKEKKQYCINSVNDEKNIIVLNSCVSWFQTEEEKEYKYLKNKKLFDNKNKCNKISINNNNLVCEKENDSFLIKTNNKLVDVPLKSMSYKDASNYAYVDKDKVVIVKNASKKEEYKDTLLIDKGYNKSDYYLLYNGSTYEFVNSKGKKIFNKEYKKAINFDEFGYARVSENGTNYYLIDKKGKNKSINFDYIKISNDYYIVNVSGKKGLLSKKGKLLMKPSYSYIEIRNINDNYYAYTYNEKEYELYNLKNNKKILSSKNSMQFNNLYIEIQEKDNKTYFNYKGKEINVNK